MRTRGLVVGFAFALSACSVRGAPESFFCHYFKERRPLKLDVSRVAVLQARQATIDAFNQALVRNGLAPGETQRVPVPRWSLTTTPATNRTESATRDLVSRLASDNSFDFVAPVFVGDDGGPVIVTPDILIGFEPTTTEQQAEAILGGITNAVILHRNWGNMKGVYHLHTAARHGLDVLALANQLAERPEVKFAEPDMIFTGHSGLVPNDPYFSNLWGIENTGELDGIAGMDMNGTKAWDITTGSSSIIVVIIDVGVQPDHPDIHQIPGTNFTSDASFDGGPVNACDNHGTAVAGCVSAIINNSLGVVGIAPGCVSASARTFIANSACDNSWTSQSSWTVNALAWAESIGARISNNSSVYGFQSSAIAQEYSSTRGHGMVHFSCAGNNASSTITYPASLPDVNAVAALNAGGGLASFSDYGTGLALSAPGQEIYTTDRTGTKGWASGDYVWANGTSFASPYAAGVAALVLSVDPFLSATNVEQILYQSCVDLGAPGYDTTYGWGFVNAYNAVQLATNYDSVGDGIPDWWRRQYFGGTGTSTNAQSCAACDPDGDGTNNLQEYLAVTDPTGSPAGGLNAQALTTLWQFGSSRTDGKIPDAALVQGSDGDFYGTTEEGGTNDTGYGSGGGTVYRINSAGTLTTLWQFRSSPTDGIEPVAALVQGSDGYFYGTTVAGGTNYGGVVYRISSVGTLTTLWQFGSSPTDGQIPEAGLVQGCDGYLYGTTYSGGTNDAGYDGTVYRISSAGTLTTLWQFGSSPTDGIGPVGALVQGSDGDFYGTTERGGTADAGVVYRISSAGTLTTLWQFDNYSYGQYPDAGLVQGSDGYFYGTTAAGGTNDDGVVFQLSVPLNPPANQIAGIEFFSVFGDTFAALLIPSVAGETYQLQYSDSVDPPDWFDTGDPITSIGGPLTLFDLVGVLPSQRFYRAVITP